MAIKSNLQIRIEKLEKHKDVQANPSLKKQVAGLRNSINESERIGSLYGQVLSLMADGLGYDDAMREVGLMKGHE